MSTLKSKAKQIRTAAKFVIHFPDDFRKNLDVCAARNHRSLNSEIVVRLQQSFLQSDQADRQLQIRMDSPQLSTSERDMLQHFRQLPPAQQHALVSLMVADT